MEFLTRFSLKNTVAVLIITFLIAAGGIVAATSLKVENMPDISFPVVLVTTTYPNASPEDVLEDVTKPLEKAVSGISGLKTLESYSNDNYSVLVLNLNSGTDVEEARDETERKVAEVKLPSEAERPKVSTESFGSAPIYYLSVSSKSKSLSPEALNQLVKDTLIEEIEGLPGVEKVKAIGDQVQEVHIYPNLQALDRHNISPSQLKQLIESNHVGIPVGSAKMDQEDRAVRLLSEYTNLEQIRRTKLFLPTGQNGGGLSYVQLGELADVKMASESEFLSRLNGDSAISLRIYKKREANEVETGNAINQKIAEFKTRYPDLKLQTVYDSSVDIKNSISGMLKEGLLGAVMASVMILFFLRNPKATFVVLLSIPLSILVSLIFMSLMGITLNIMTLGGLAIAVGRVVDDSIVVIENIFRHLQLKREGRDPELIRVASKEVTNAITSSTLTTVAVFVPIAFVSGVLGEVFRPFAVTVVCSLLASLIVAVTVVPLMTKLTLLRSTNIKEHEPGRIAHMYRNILTWSLQHKGKTLILAALLLFGSFGLAATLHTALMPESDQKYIVANLTMSKGTSLEVTDKMAQRVEAIFKQEPTLEYLESYIGSNFEGAESQISNRASMFMKLHKDADINAVEARFRKETEAIMPAGAKISINQLTGGGPLEAYQIVLNGPDKAKLRQAAEMVRAKLEQNPLMTNITDNLSDTKSEIAVRVDRDKAAEYGLSPIQVAGDVRSLLADLELGKMTIDGTEYDLILGLREEDVDSIEKIRALIIKTPTGQQVRLGDIAKVVQEEAPSQIRQRDEKQYVLVSADITSTDKGGVGAAATAEVKKLKLPDGVTLSTAGVTEEIQKSFIEMFYALGAAVFMVYIVMIISFGNAMAPLSILLSLPLAAIGGLFGLFVTQSTLDITSMIGFLMLIGIVVTNAIVLIDRVQQQRENGLSTREALIEAGITRLRPIIMTAVATIVALFPLALGMSEGALISKGLAIVVIGGLITSTLLTLVVVPVGYEFFDKVRTRFFDRRERKLEAKRLKKAQKTAVEGV
ncbi:efflux RND transporter permease subunit [Effusibacillus lacus]|uniref:AcrB/AcrD/AcrF family protein n=1 Tax=Effusibacillus lacus TaxID=1348429 RepID=A0A292YSZ2_9BACL|nr:efflux RND transporter permease subunit [Effusibacillus lacus]TCS73749.1 multidrug efflux pump subunit AcrB [Effusibacillus lacus]GAX92039.1 AcrB/AcrD/AcrF family protein [Effusibacillus lacus]